MVKFTIESHYSF